MGRGLPIHSLPLSTRRRRKNIKCNEEKDEKNEDSNKLMVLKQDRIKYPNHRFNNTEIMTPILNFELAVKIAGLEWRYKRELGNIDEENLALVVVKLVLKHCISKTQL